jgi:hypothetical protein
MYSIKFPCVLLAMYVLVTDAAFLYNECEYGELAKCNSGFMFDFSKHGDLQQFTLYCHGFQVHACQHF